MIICIQGLGYVGSTTCVAIALAKNKFNKKNFKIVGVEKATIRGEEIINKINKGIFPFQSTDKTLKKSMKEINKMGILQATHSNSIYEKANIVLVSINCDVVNLNGRKKVDLSSFKKSIAEIGNKIRENTLIIIESTVPPGTCSEIVYPTLRSIFLKRKLNPEKIYLAHSYERVTPGKNYLSSVINNYRVYSGINKESAKKCKNFLEKVVNVKKYPLFRLKNTNSSELSKLMENSYRATNIAFIEEWSRFAEKINVDLFKVIKAIKKRPTHNNIKDPGFGVGGYCLTKDPLMAMIGAKQIFNIKQDFQFSKLAVKTNNEMPTTTINKIKDFYNKKLNKKKILLLGATYKEDIADTRYSPSEFFLKKITSLGAEVIVHDPLVKFWNETKRKVLNKIPDFSRFDVIVFAVKHKQYKKIIFKKYNKKTFLIVDANNILTEKQKKIIKDKKINFISIGRG
jgi:UDP-N-acetyl-D-glucosamine dehydrogenase